MKPQASRTSQVVAPAAGAQPKRRRLVVGAGLAAGAAFAAAAALRHQAQAPGEIAKVEPDTAKAEGYRLTDHVLRYYETTRT